VRLKPAWKQAVGGVRVDEGKYNELGWLPTASHGDRAESALSAALSAALNAAVSQWEPMGGSALCCGRRQSAAAARLALRARSATKAAGLLRRLAGDLQATRKHFFLLLVGLQLSILLPRPLKSRASAAEMARRRDGELDELDELDERDKNKSRPERERDVRPAQLLVLHHLRPATLSRGGRIFIFSLSRFGGKRPAQKRRRSQRGGQKTSIPRGLDSSSCLLSTSSPTQVLFALLEARRTRKWRPEVGVKELRLGPVESGHSRELEPFDSCQPSSLE